MKTMIEVILSLLAEIGIQTADATQNQNKQTDPKHRSLWRFSLKWIVLIIATIAVVALPKNVLKANAGPDT